MRDILRSLTLILLLLTGTKLASAEKIHVACASNFSKTAKLLAASFEKKFPHKVVLSFGSSGKLYSQITNGAPFDVFLSADIRRVKLLEENGYAVKGSRFTYAYGQLALWRPGGLGKGTTADLIKKKVSHFSIANPKLAPYGRASVEVLKKMGEWERLSGSVVMAENISQAYAFISSGNAQMGLVGLSFLKGNQSVNSSHFSTIPTEWYSPIEQQAAPVSEKKAGIDFLNYLKGPESRRVIQNAGYQIPSVQVDKL